MLQDKKLLQAAYEYREKTSWKRYYLTLFSIKENFDKKVKWFKSGLTELLDNHAKITKVSAYSKQWWNKEIAKARKRWAKSKKKFDRNDNHKNKFTQVQNLYYETIWKVKKLCWQNFLQEKMENIRQQT